MISKYPLVQLVELGEIVTGGTPSSKIKQAWGNLVPFLTPSDMKGTRHPDKLSRYLSEQGREILKKCIVPHGIAVSCIGSIIGKTMLIRSEIITNQQLNSLIPYDNVYDDYVYYCLNSMIDYMQQLGSSGTTMPIINKTLFGQIKIPLPPLAEQKAIAEILTSLDDKIDNLTKQNLTLESMIQTFFKSMTSNPLMKKEETRKMTIIDTLNNSFEQQNEDVLEGWTVSKLSSLVDIYGGKQLDRNHFLENGKYLVFGGAGIMGRSDVYNEDGFTISFGRVGAYCGQFYWHDGKSWINNNASVVKPKDIRYAKWIYCLLSNFPIDILKKGTSQPFVSNQDLLDIDITYPPLDVILKFNEMTSDLFSKIKNNNDQIDQLKKTRDYLLPKLLSGQI
jgi:type I restriction enzyme S subunit